MNDNAPNTSPLIPVIRWTARILSLALVILLMIIAVGESWNSPIPWTHLRPLELGMFGALGLALFGLLVAWRWELIGALMNLGGTTLFTLGLIALKGLHFRFFWIEGALALFGLMFLLCWASNRRQGSPQLLQKEDLC